jgi:hypothetical protein
MVTLWIRSQQKLRCHNQERTASWWGVVRKDDLGKSLKFLMTYSEHLRHKSQWAATLLIWSSGTINQ